MTTKTMLFGPIGRMLPVPYPEADMGWDTTRRTEETELLSGGTHVYEAPTPFRRYKLQYKGGTPDLQNLVDIYNGVYGKGPYYLLDFNYTAGNLLPTRWASAYMLGYVADTWCVPVVEASASALAGEQVTFTNLGQFPAAGISQMVATVPGEPAYLHLWGSRTGSGAVMVSLLNASTGVWTSPVACVPGASPAQVEIVSAAEGIANTYSAIKLQLNVPSGSSLTLDHINLSTVSGDNTRKPGLGVGAVSFTSSLSGNIVTKRFDRIGLSLDLVEVE
jgi:hypothetical protein